MIYDFFVSFGQLVNGFFKIRCKIISFRAYIGAISRQMLAFPSFVATWLCISPFLWSYTRPVLALSEREVSSSISSNFMLDTRLRRHRHSGISSPLCCVHYSGFYTDEFPQFPLISLPKIEIFYDFCTFICIIEYFFVPL